MINMDFDLNALKIFLAVYENKGIEAASKKLFLTQPAVSIAIKKLENKLNGKLFSRLPKGIKPTPEGEKFYIYCKNALMQISQGIQNFSEDNALQYGTLKIGANSSLIKFVLMPVLTEFCQKYPNIKLSFTEVIASRLQRYLFKGELDIAFMEEPILNKEIYDSFPMVTLTHIFVSNPHYKTDFLTKDELEKQKFSVQKNNTNNRFAFHNFCLDHALNLSVQYEMANNETLLEITKQVNCVGFSTKEFCNLELENKVLKEIKTDIELPKTTVFGLLPKGDTNGFATQKLIEFIKNYYKS